MRSQRLVQSDYYLLGPWWGGVRCSWPPWQELGYVPKRIIVGVSAPSLGYYLEGAERLGLALAVFAMRLIDLLRRRAALRRNASHFMPAPPDHQASDVE